MVLHTARTAASCCSRSFDKPDGRPARCDLSLSAQARSDGAAMLALQIACAGVWLNGMLCSVCWLLSLLLPALLLPLYSSGQGAVIWCVPFCFFLGQAYIAIHLRTEMCKDSHFHIATWQVRVRCSIMQSIPKYDRFRKSRSDVRLGNLCASSLHRSMPQQSALRDFLQPGDTITSINGCDVRGTDSLRACIYSQVRAAHMYLTCV